MTRRRAWRPLLLLLIVTMLAIAPSAAMARKGVGTTSASAWVFAPNPVASSGNQDLLDNKDADSPELDAELVKSVTLTHLDGSGYLRGAYAAVVSETGAPAFETDGSYEYTRHDDRFEQVMAYYWVTQSQLYLQELDFGTGLEYPPINEEPQAVRINQWGVDNSFATTHPKDEMRFGKGGVDDAEDAEVILHEYGHQIHFSQGFPYGSYETDAIGEGFGDYWAATVSEEVLDDLGLSSLVNPACIADWDSVSYTSTVPHCLRRVDLNLHYPEDLNGRIHHDGQIWSRALWDIRGALGNEIADTIIINGQWNFIGTTMPQLAQATLAWAETEYGNPSPEAAAVLAAFRARGIL